jgi:hypothetical protein
VVNQSVVNQAVVGNRPWGGYHTGWYQGGWGSFGGAVPSFWGGAAAAVAAPGVGIGGFSPTYSGTYAPSYSSSYSPTFTFSNPYYDFSSTEVSTGLDYSEPIAVPTARQVERTDEEVPRAATRLLDTARAQFRRGQYADALDTVEDAIARLPGDPTLHEFRALVLFARGRYRSAAAALYAVLATGPGMNWDTMSTLYPDNDTYTRQLRVLERYVKGHPKAGYGHFLLAYHYLVLDERDGAREELGTVVKLNPKDTLARQLSDALSQKPEDKTKPSES